MMTGHEVEAEAQEREATEVESNTPSWLRATVSDIGDLDFEGPIADNNSADCHELSTAYREAAELHEKLGDEAAAPAARAFAMLAAVTDFQFHPNDRNAPYGARLISGDRRSAIPEDFRGESLLVLADAAERAKNPVLRARLSDVCWLLERKRHNLGKAAVASYVAVVEALGSGRLKDAFERDDPMLGLTARDTLRRALTIGRAVGWDNDDVLAARKLLTSLRARAIKDGESIQVHWFFEMDLDFGISRPSEIAAEIEEFLGNGITDLGSHTTVELWRLAAHAYHHARDDEGKYRCGVAAAEALVAESEQQESAMLASHWLSAAIAQYHGIPGKRVRRTELRHKLIDAQSGISEEMSPFSQPMDLREIVEQVEKQLEGQRELVDLLLIFADSEQSPSPETLVADAIKSITDHPLSSIFGTSFHDHEGKVIHRSEGGGFGDGNDDAIRVQIAQQERFRREIFVAGTVEVVRQHIVDRYYLSEDTFQALLRHSVFVPQDVIGTYSRGFKRFFEGDYTSALYILTPMLENSLRHVLKMNGHDVTTFDDARQVQEDRTISALFDQSRLELEETFGKAITADIDNVFLLKPGPSLRHGVAHGLLGDAGPYSADATYACWLIFRLCCIPLFRQREQIVLPS